MLSDAQLTELRRQLQTKQKELKEQLAELALSMEQRADCSIADSGDAASFLESRYRAAALYAHHEQTLREVVAALERMRRGNYGYDEETGEAMAWDKLQAVPWRRRG